MNGINQELTDKIKEYNDVIKECNEKKENFNVENMDETISYIQRDINYNNGQIIKNKKVIASNEPNINKLKTENENINSFLAQLNQLKINESLSEKKYYLLDRKIKLLQGQIQKLFQEKGELQNTINETNDKNNKNDNEKLKLLKDQEIKIEQEQKQLNKRLIYYENKDEMEKVLDPNKIFNTEAKAPEKIIINLNNQRVENKVIEDTRQKAFVLPGNNNITYRVIKKGKETKVKFYDNGNNIGKGNYGDVSKLELIASYRLNTKGEFEEYDSIAEYNKRHKDQEKQDVLIKTQNTEGLNANLPEEEYQVILKLQDAFKNERDIQITKIKGKTSDDRIMMKNAGDMTLTQYIKKLLIIIKRKLE